jgi:translocation and assembly module TamB
VQCDLKLNPKLTSSLHINADTLHLSTESETPQLIKHVQLDFDGPLNNHQLAISINHPQVKLDLQTTGQLDMEQLSWQGVIKQLSLDSADFGHWQQQKKSRLFASANQAQLSSLCLQEQGTQLCTDVNWSPEKGQANIHLSHLSFDRAAPFLPEEIKQFSGEIDLQAKVDLGPVLLAQLTTKISSGTLIYQGANQKSIRLDHKNGLLNAHYSAQKLSAKWALDLGPHTVNGQLSLPRTAIEADPLTAPIQGNLNIDITDLSMVSVLVPQINTIEGHLLTQLRFSGNAQAPRISGQTELVASIIDIQQLGTRFSDVTMTISDKQDGEILVLNGGIKSEKGALALLGQVTLDVDQGFPIELDIKGENFLAINIPDIYAILSPDIHFSQTQGLMTIQGKLVIPDAFIAPSSIPEGSISASSDVTILGEETETPANMNLDLTIQLGDKVHLDAFGLTTDLVGEMTINQKPKQIMVAHGELHLENGSFRAYGQDLSIDEGSVFYAGGYLDNPGLKFTASKQIKDIQVGIKVSGTAKKPTLDTFSDDTSLTDKDILALMLTGQKIDNIANARIYAGTEINDKLSVGVNAGMGDEGSEFVTRYQWSDSIQLEGTSSASKSGGNILYTFELE